MARKVDKDKLARIKHATMKTIVDCGIEKTTIAMIAKNANVSGGYLYRMYSGKQALINELYFEKVDSLNTELAFLIGLNEDSISSILKAFVQNRVVYAKNEPVASTFFYQMLHNDNFVISDDLTKTSINIMESLKAIGSKSGEISTSVTLLQLQYHLLFYVVNYIHFKHKNFLRIEETLNIDVDYIVNNILTILKREN